MKIAVTGATGFIGLHVLEELTSHDVELVAVAQPNRKNLPVLKNGYWVYIDIANPPTRVYEKINKPDIVIHLAWHGLPNYRSLHHFETELPLQYEFLKQLITQGLNSLVVTGTCFEYGMQSGPLSEETQTRPVTPYGYSKDALRRQLMFIQEVYPFNLTWARLFYIYGDGQTKNSLFAQLKKAVQQGEKYFNMSGGEQIRDYLPVGEVARRLLLLALKQQDMGVVNVCSGKPQSVRSLVEQWIRENKWDINLNLGHYTYMDYEPMAFWGLSKINQEKK